ncbi:MAG: hypothetical protein WBD69_09945 [Candidatus Cybelea sp.]
MQRKILLRRLCESVVALEQNGPIRVAIDGIDGAGKTTLADELVPFIEGHGRTVIRASVDGFHRPREARYRRGIDSPEGFYRDSFDYGLLRSALLDPLGPGGTRQYRTTSFDWRTNSNSDAPVLKAAPDAVLLFDGIFAQRPELRDVWDFVIFLHVEFEEALRRSQVRDARTGQSRFDLERRFWCRYAAGQRLYFVDAQPRLKADIVIDNSDPKEPIVI